jgi:3-isopropylmalate/(R)-2-methylmalate dehydratase small subunit
MPAERIMRITGTALPMRGHNIDTDRIIPARFLRSVSFEGLEAHLFEDDRAAAGEGHPVSNPSFASATLMFVNTNFGCGSSREHAPQAIRRLGIRALIGESFSEIFFGNAVALGMPCVAVGADDAARLLSCAEEQPGTVFTLDLLEMRVEGGGTSAAVVLPAAARESFLDGSWDATALLLDDFAQVRAVAGRLPYLSGWPSPQA